MNFQTALADYLAAKEKFMRETANRFPRGQWVSVKGTQIVGMVWRHHEDDCEYVDLILEHGHPRTKKFAELEECEMPPWGKRVKLTTSTQQEQPT